MAAKATVLTARQILDRQISEAELQQNIITLARRCGYYVFHSWSSLHSERGMPDLIIVADRLIFMEVKTERGRLSREQRDVIHRLRAAGCLALVVRPSMWSQIENMLLSGRWEEAS
jgi:hypothetical protein